MHNIRCDIVLKRFAHSNSIYGPRSLSKPKLKDIFRAKSEYYEPGDELLLPYPERSRAGVFLLSMAQALAAADVAVALEPKNTQYAQFLKKKLLKLSGKTYYAAPDEIRACIHSNNEEVSPFDYWRSSPDSTINLPHEKTFLVMNPSLQIVADGDEYSVSGALVSKSVEQVTRELRREDTGVIKALANVGLTHVVALQSGVWLEKRKE